MDLLIAFGLFVLCMGASLALHVTMLAPLAVGFALFVAVAVRRGTP